MPKVRRTKKEKTQAHHHFTVSWQPTVKGHFAERKIAGNSQKSSYEKAEQSAENAEIKSIKANIIKSIIIVSLILATELVIYLAVRK